MLLGIWSNIKGIFSFFLLLVYMTFKLFIPVISSQFHPVEEELELLQIGQKGKTDLDSWLAHGLFHGQLMFLIRGC